MESPPTLDICGELHTLVCSSLAAFFGAGRSESDLSSGSAGQEVQATLEIAVEIQGRVIAAGAQGPQVAPQSEAESGPEPGASSLARQRLSRIDQDLVQERVVAEQGFASILDQPVHASLGLRLLQGRKSFERKEDVSEGGEA